MRTTARATAVEIAAVLLTALAIPASIIPLMWAIRTPWAGAPLATWFGMGGLTTFFFAGLLIVFARGGGYITRALSHPLPLALGGLSYALYLVHPPVLIFYKFRQLAFPPLPTWIMASLLAVLLLIMAHTLHVVVEMPCWRGIVAAGRKLGAWFERTGQLRPAAITYVTCAHAPVVPMSMSRRLVLRGGSVVLCTGMIGLWLWMGTYRLNVPVLKGGELQTFLSRARFETLDVRFGDEFTLLGVVVEETKVGGVELRLAWRAERDTKLRYNTLVHTIASPEDNPIVSADKRQDATESTVTKGTIWRDRIVLGPKQVEGAKFVAIGLYRGMDRLEADRGPRDWDNCRLLLTIK
jgi:hypothetical protein